jgi:hypothetical protein
MSREWVPRRELGPLGKTEDTKSGVKEYTIMTMSQSTYRNDDDEIFIQP